MKKSNNKGQSSVEFMMTYGWTLLVMAAVLVALYYMNVFQPPSTPPGCSGFSQITPLDHKAVSATKTIEISFQNDAGMKLLITSVTASVYGVDCGAVALPADPNIRAGDFFSVTIPGCELPETNDEYYKADIIVGYTNPTSGISHSSVGECHGMTE